MPVKYFKAEANLGYFDFLYFSTVTITTLGFGDIVPINDTSKLVVAIQAIWGLINFGLLINNLIQYTINKKSNQMAMRKIQLSLSMIDYIEEYLYVSLEKKHNRGDNRIQRYTDMVNILRYHPAKFKFSDYLIENILWAVDHSVNDMRSILVLQDFFSENYGFNLSTVISNLERLQVGRIKKKDDIKDFVEYKKFLNSLFLIFANLLLINEEVKIQKIFVNENE